MFLRLNQTQITLIRSLTETNQSLLNQVRATDLSSLSGLMVATSAPVNDEYISTDARELAALSSSYQTGLGSPVYDDDLETFRSSI